MKETLRDLITSSNDLMARIAESGGELSPELEQELTQLDLSTKDKITSYWGLLRHIKAMAESLGSMATFYANGEKSLWQAHKRIRGALKNALLSVENKELVGNGIVFKLRNSKATLVVDANLIEEDYLYTVVSTQINKDKIREDLEAGIPVKGAQLVESFALIESPNKGI